MEIDKTEAWDYDRENRNEIIRKQKQVEEQRKIEREKMINAELDV